MTSDQAQAVYAAEDLWESKEPAARVRFGDWNEVWPFYYLLTNRLKELGIVDENFNAPTVKPRKGSLQAHYDASLATVFIPPYDKGGSWALRTSTAIHEYVHHLTPGVGHGPRFRQAMVDVLEAMDWDHELLADCYAEAGLTTSDKAEGLTDKVSKLLTHADKAGTDEERRTYIEKAEGLAAEHSINLALLRKKQADRDENTDRPTTGKMFSLTAIPSVTYRNLAVELGTAIGRAHGARCLIRGKSQYITFLGFPEDIHLTELMLTRISPMMFEEADRYLKSPEHKRSGTATVSARITFCKHFAWEVGKRLKEAVKQTEQRIAETREIGAASTELALREKALEVADYVAYEHKRLGVRGSWSGSNTSKWSGSAASAGETAAQNANLFGRKELN